MTTQTHVPFTIVLALAATLMIGPFSIDTYLPAFPLMADSLGVDIHAVSLSISVYIFSLAIGQLVGGPMSDHFGRRGVLIGGLLLFAGASFGLAFSQSLNALLLGRALQAFGAGWAVVSVPALVRDRVRGQQAAKLFSMIGLVMIVAPGIAPGIGSLLLRLGSWEIIFVFLGLYALAVIPLLLVTVFRGPRPPAPVRDAAGPGVLARYHAVLKTTPALPFIGWQAATFSGLVLFVTYASYIYQIHFGQSKDAFALLFALNIVAMFSFNLLNRVLLSYVTSLRILQAATVAQAAGMVGLLFSATLDLPLAAFVVSMMLYAGSLGAMSPNNNACFLEHFSGNSGSAAALMGATTFGISGLLSGLTTLLPHTLVTIVLSMSGCALVSFSFMLLSLRRPR
ncbi:multidrug effflux MFS transporter [Kineobactrum salinum]|uniref:Bcr/CflA family efflux transporter n=1 Tax=Kineobactrum salinum TaxID=2708301 RepID=A0A6C0TYX2_9GAMM|nr:multidrug effflux MFS transporter [Kineobactrum salinum]QIB65022.1 multidrug effflux MFS transporter [Kineobactrum salinum]